MQCIVWYGRVWMGMVCNVSMDDWRDGYGWMDGCMDAWMQVCEIYAHMYNMQ